MEWDKEIKWLAFDIETAQAAPEDHRESYALGITCIASTTWPDGRTKVWTPDFNEEKGCYDLTMSVDQVRAFCEYLSHMTYSLSYVPVTINGTAFDYRVLAEEADSVEIYDNMRDLALISYDPAFQILCDKGYPISMQAMAQAFGLIGKEPGMDGLAAVRMWKSGITTSQERVMRYVANDASTTYQIAQKIAETTCIRWMSKKGNMNQRQVEGLVVHQCLKMPLPNMHWWKIGEPPQRSEFVEWVLEEGDIEREGYKL